MTTPTPRETVNLAELYEQELMPWSRAAEALGEGSVGAETAAFLSTVRPDGRPHAAGIGIAIHDGVPYFTTGPKTRKGRNLAANPACTLALRLDGLDLVLEGTAERVTDAETLAAVAADYREGGWPAHPEGDALTATFSAQSAGPPPWYLYRLVVDTAFGVGTREPGGASRWRF
jgi:pyridoxine/pyridoxamine 5'-phosphate oxidase